MALWFNKEEFDSAPKKLCLLKTNNHFHGILSVPGFLNRSFIATSVIKALAITMQNITIARDRTATSVGGPKASAKPLKIDSPPACFVLTVASRSGDPTVLTHIKAPFVPSLKNVLFAVKCTNLKRKRNMCVESIAVVIVE